METDGLAAKGADPKGAADLDRRDQLQRIVVVGSSCAGKTTFARRLAATLNLLHTSLDDLFWRPGWQHRDDFVERVTDVVAGERWIVEGNYGAVRDVVWQRATDLIWLDYAFPVVFSRALRRTVRRVVTKELACGGNRETFRHAFLSPDGIPYWVLRSFRPARRTLSESLAAPEHAHLLATILRRSHQAETYLKEMEQGSKAGRVDRDSADLGSIDTVL